MPCKDSQWFTCAQVPKLNLLTMTTGKGLTIRAGGDESGFPSRECIRLGKTD